MGADPLACDSDAPVSIYIDVPVPCPAVPVTARRLHESLDDARPVLLSKGSVDQFRARRASASWPPTCWRTEPRADPLGVERSTACFAVPGVRAAGTVVALPVHRAHSACADGLLAVAYLAC